MTSINLNETLTPSRRERDWRLLLIRLLAVAAMLIGVYLTVVAFLEHGKAAGCGGGSGCDEVLSSSWSRLFGLPVSLFAVLTYLVLLSGTFLAKNSKTSSQRRTGWLVMLATASSIVIASLWFTALQIFVVKQICPYCMTEHGVGVVIALLIFIRTPWKTVLRQQAEASSTPPLTRSAVVLAMIFGVIGSSGFAVAQIAFRLPTHSIAQHEVVVSGVGAERTITMTGGHELRLSQTPLIGSVEAKHLIIALFDYTCPHCRKMNEHFDKVRDLYGDQVAIVILPMPLDPDCNPNISGNGHEGSCEYSKLALAVGQTSRENFQKFHAWVFAGNATPQLAERYAAKLIGQDLLNSKLQDGSVDQQLQQNIAIFSAAGRGGVPTLFLGSQVVTGSIGSAEELFQLLEQNLGLVPKGWSL